MSLKQQLLDSLAETQALYTHFSANNLQARVSRLHQLRELSFQTKYLDYFNQARYKPALDFVLSDVYSSLLHKQRDEKIAKAFSSMSRVLPDAILETITKAVCFNCNMLRLDHKLVAASSLDADDIAYHVLINTEELVQLHTALVHDFVALARSIDHFVKKPFMQMTLKASRIPAKAANLYELQEFLETCFSVFKTMRSPDAFLIDYQHRELLLTQ